MERIRQHRRRVLFALAVLVPALAVSRSAHAQFPGGSETYTFRVVDQHGRPLDGSFVRVEGTTDDRTSPAIIEAPAGPQLVTITPAAQGAMLPGGVLRPAAPNGLTRNEFVFLPPGGGEVLLTWNTVDVAVSVVDQHGAAIAGATWGFAGDGAAYGPGTLTLPVTDESAHMNMVGPSIDGWQFDVRAAFDGASIDLVRSDRREFADGATALAFEWHQSTCTMGVVDGTGAAIRGATWTVLGRTFSAGDAITWPTTDDAGLTGAFADGFPVTLTTSTIHGNGDATFEVNASGSPAPEFVAIGGGSFGLRCGVTAFPPLTTGTLAVSVTADGAAFAGAQVTVTDANGAVAVYQTANDGTFGVNDVQEGPIMLVLAVPAGHHAVDPSTGTISTLIAVGETRSVTFSIARDTTPPPAPVNTPETWSYWRREVSAAIRGTGRRDETPADMAVNYPQAIFDGFAMHPTSPVRIQGVTLVGDHRLALADMDATLSAGGSDEVHAAKRELLVVLLNVVSGRLSLHLVVDGAGHTLEEEIRRLAGLIDGDPANARLARAAAENLNSGKAGRRMAVNDNGRHDEERDDTIAATTLPVALGASRTGGAVRLALTMKEAGSATVDVYDVRGVRVARLLAGDAPAGTTELTWNSGGRRGVWFARATTGQGTATTKIVVGW